jgi:hypothetical protein
VWEGWATGRSALIEPADLALETGYLELKPFNCMEGTFESRHPTAETFLLGL